MYVMGLRKYWYVILCKCLANVPNTAKEMYFHRNAEFPVKQEFWPGGKVTHYPNV